MIHGGEDASNELRNWRTDGEEDSDENKKKRLVKLMPQVYAFKSHEDRTLAHLLEEIYKLALTSKGERDAPASRRCAYPVGGAAKHLCEKIIFYTRAGFRGCAEMAPMAQR
ncbi:hypothetical protein MRX96_031602 [Rhipicephalus microplus]